MPKQPYQDARLRESPYAWVTWITKLVSGEATCEWALWFRARHYWDKLESGADLNSWTADHDALVTWRAKKLRADGLTVFLERDLRLEGKTATISGKPDIGYDHEGVFWFEDCKTGKKRDSDHVQVLMYMWLYSFRYKVPIRGRVVYKDAVIDVDHERLTNIKDAVLKLIAMATSNSAPSRSPSPSECRSCNIPSYYCEDRQHSPNGEIFQTDEF
jgi:CRISPR/Cas system-associated exonuclease Cas4 (RecB family)